MPEVIYRFEADTTDLEKALAEARAGMKDLQNQSKKSSKSMVDDSKKEAAASKEVTKEIKDTATGISKLGKIAIPAMGELGEKFGGALEAITTLNPAVVALAGGFIGAAGLVIGAIAAAKGIYALQEAAFAATDKLDKLHKAGVNIVSSEDLQNVKDAQYAIDGVKVGFGSAAVAIASEFAPALERISVDLLALAVAAIENKSALLDMLTKPYREWAKLQGEMALNIAAISSKLGFSKYANDQLQYANMWALTAAGVDDTGTALDDLEKRYSKYVDKAKEIISKNQDITKTHKQQKVEIDKTAEALKKLEEIQHAASISLYDEELKILDARDQKLAQINELAIQSGNLAAANLAAAAVEEETQAQLTKLHEDELKKRTEAENKAREEKLKLDEQAAKEQERIDRQITDSKIALAQTSFSAIQDLTNLSAGKNKEAQRRAFAVNKASGIAQAILSTAVGVARANELPYPANIFAMIATGIQGAVAIAKVASTKPPQFYSGIDEVKASPTGSMALLHPGEAVLNRTEAEKYRNSTNSSSNNQMTQIWIDGKEIASSTSKQIKRGGSITSEINRRSGNLGHYNRR